MKQLDNEIKDLVEFFNSLPTVKTIGCCQGHNTGTFDSAYITFTCNNERVLGFLASISCAYEDTGDWKPENIRKQPHLKALWNISVIVANDSEFTPEELKADGREVEYINYCLTPDINSYEKPSDIYTDFAEILKYYKCKWSKIYSTL